MKKFFSLMILTVSCANLLAMKYRGGLAQEDSPPLAGQALATADSKTDPLSEGRLIDFLYSCICKYTDKQLTHDIVELFFEGQTPENSATRTRFIDDIREKLLKASTLDKKDANLDTIEHAFSALRILQKYEKGDNDAHIKK